MSKCRIIAETVIEIEADSKEDAAERFYDEVYEVDRHGNYRIERLPNELDHLKPA